MKSISFTSLAFAVMLACPHGAHAFPENATVPEPANKAAAGSPTPNVPRAETPAAGAQRLPEPQPLGKTFETTHSGAAARAGTH